MRFSPQFLDEIRARLPVSQVVSRKVALKRAGREFKGLSPFKTEKTPSFTVNDQKGFYHCFASGEHGDIFTFVMKTEGLSFPEAVERLAAEAGIPMPKPERGDGREAERADARKRLHDLLEVAATWFEKNLAEPPGQDARRYLDRRGLQRETIAAFRLGFAPAGRSALKEHMAALGFTPQEMAASGMQIAGDDIPVPYDRFRNRVMFPICDLKGRVIAFGGRALDPDAPAKYLNSPETPLFHKGDVLFNAARARQAAYERGRIVVVEGYMDVIALAQAGFAEAVAPLGTALTESQMQMLWRMAPEPILCFDGDSAGLRAAYRAIDTALPLLKAGTSLSFAFLPSGLDPDDLIRQAGSAAFSDILAQVRPLADILWEREWSAGQWTTPERRAHLERRLFTLIDRIGEPAVRVQYQREVRARLTRSWQGSGSAPWSGSATYPVAQVQRRARNATGRHGDKGYGRGSDRSPAPRSRLALAPASTLKFSALVAQGRADIPRREALLLYALVNHPWLLDEHAETIAALAWTSKAAERLRDTLLSLHAEHNFLDTAQLKTHLTGQGLAKILALVERAITHRGDKFAEPEADRATVETGWRHALALHERQVGLRHALAAAEQAWHAEGSEEALARICELQSLLNRSDGVEAFSEGEFEGEGRGWSA